MKRVYCLLLLACSFGLLVCGCKETDYPITELGPQGVYEVGKDIAPGEYVAIPDGDTEFCDCFIYNDSSLEPGKGGSSSGFMKRFIFTVDKGQFVQIGNFEPTRAYPIDKIDPATVENGYLPAGIYKVGFDIPAGEYTLESVAKKKAHYFINKSSVGWLSADVSKGEFSENVTVMLEKGQYIAFEDAKMKVE